MRAVFAAAILLLGLPTYAQESASAPLVAVSLGSSVARSISSTVAVESPPARVERNGVTATSPVQTGEQTATPAASRTAAPAAPQPTPPPVTSSDIAGGKSPNSGNADIPPSLQLDQLCGALLTSAQDNDLPVAFFANLIWQESRLRDDAVSLKGALGIAQFMPKVAAASGLQNPFDPLQALTASARLLRGLRDQFGNLGFVAAAYNAGAKRVGEWLKRRRALPKETRGYVVNVTGRSVEQWQKAPPSDDSLRFARLLPCRNLPAFAGLEQAQAEQAEHEPAPHGHDERPQPQRTPAAKVAEKAASARRAASERLAERRHRHVAFRHEAIHEAEHDRRKREARERMRRASHDQHRRA